MSRSGRQLKRLIVSAREKIPLSLKAKTNLSDTIGWTVMLSMWISGVVLIIILSRLDKHLLL